MEFAAFPINFHVVFPLKAEFSYLQCTRLTEIESELVAMEKRLAVLVEARLPTDVANHHQSWPVDTLAVSVECHPVVLVAANVKRRARLQTTNLNSLLRHVGDSRNQRILGF